MQINLLQHTATFSNFPAGFSHVPLKDAVYSSSTASLKPRPRFPHIDAHGQAAYSSLTQNILREVFRVFVAFGVSEECVVLCQRITKGCLNLIFTQGPAY